MYIRWDNRHFGLPVSHLRHLAATKHTFTTKKLPTPAENDSPFSSKYLQSDSKSLSRLCNSFAAFRRQRFVSEIRDFGCTQTKILHFKIGFVIYAFI